MRKVSVTAAAVGAVAVVLLVTIVVIGPAGLTGGHAPDGADTNAIRGVVTRALRLLQDESVASHATDGGPMSDQVRAELEANAMARARLLFSGLGLTWFEGVVKYNLDEQASGMIRHLGGGVSTIDFTSIAVSGDHATVAVTEDVWADIAQVQDSGKVAVAHPKNTMLASLLLERTEGVWYVTDYRAGFAPGSEP